jgi:formate dehydrogenase
MHETKRTDPRFPLRLISRRRVDMMNSHLSEYAGANTRGRSDVVELNNADGAALGIATGDPVRVESRVASVDARAALSADVRPGVVVMEQGWGGRTVDPTAPMPPPVPGVNRNELVAGDELAPLSAVPLLNGTAVRVGRRG